MAPTGYDQAVYGPWPVGGAHLVKMRLPPTYKSPGNQGNWHTVTLLVSDQRDPRHNPLMMGEGLEQLIDSYCGCRGGLRTCALCCHRVAAILLLMATQCVNVAKAPEALIVDTAW